MRRAGARVSRPRGEDPPQSVEQLSYLQAVVIGFLQGATELFPVSSLGHSVLVPAWLGGDWQRLVESRRDLELAWWQLPPAAVLAALSRLVDLAGMVRALAPGGRESGVGI